MSDNEDNRYEGMITEGNDEPIKNEPAEPVETEELEDNEPDNDIELEEPSEDSGDSAEVSSDKDEPGDSNEDAEPEGDEPKQEKQNGIQKRISQLTAKVSSAEEENIRLRAQIEQINQAKTQDSKQERPEPPSADMFDDYDAYTEAIDKYNEKYNAEPAIQAPAPKSQESVNTDAINTNNQILRSRIASWADRPDDYEQVINSSYASPAMLEVLASNAIDNAPEIIYEIGKNPELIKQLESMTETERVAQVGVLSHKVKQQAFAAAKSKAKITNAKPPVKAGQTSKSKKTVQGAKDFGQYEDVRSSQGINSDHNRW